MSEPTFPGLRAVDHLGLVVPDIDVAIRLFCDALGAVVLYRHGPHRDGHPPIQERNFARHAETTVDAIAMLRLGQLQIELLQFSAPDQRTAVPRTSDLGGHHLALYVDDIHGAAAHLRRHGVRVLGDPLPLPGPEAGANAEFVFALTSWGLAIELISYPHGKGVDVDQSASAHSTAEANDVPVPTRRRP